MKEVKKCAECGKMHTRKKFCSPYCGCKYNANYKRNEMEAISSTDFKHNEEEKPKETKTPNLDDMLNKVEDSPTKTFASSDKPKVSSF